MPKIRRRVGENIKIIMAKSTLVDFYKVKQTTDSVELEVIIGFAQTAVSVVRVDGKKINSDFRDSFKTKLGSNKVLNGKELFLTIVVQDISKKTNNTSVTIKLTGGIKTYSAIMKQTVLEEGGVSSYVANIEFYE